MASPPKTTSDYFALVRNAETEELVIVMFDNVDRADISWLTDKTKWPGSLNPNRFLKVAKWIRMVGEAEEEERGELLFIGSREETELEKVRCEPAKETGGVTIDFGPFLDSMNSMVSRMDKLEGQNAYLRSRVDLLEKDKNFVYDQMSTNSLRVTAHKNQLPVRLVRTPVTGLRKLESSTADEKG